MGIEVNGRAIESKAINIESANHQEPGADPRFAIRRAAVALTIRELMLQRAEQLGIAVSGDEEALDGAIEDLIQREVAYPAADEETCQRWYQQNPAQFRTPDLVEVRHILLAAPPDILEERDAARATAEALIADLQQQPDGFARLAKKHSRCPSGKEGGLLGQVTRGETVPEFEDAVLRLPVGLSGTPVKTRYGFHVVEVLQRVEGMMLPFQAVHGRISEYLQERSRRRAISQYVRLLAGEAQIKGIDLDAAESLLIQ